MSTAQKTNSAPGETPDQEPITPSSEKKGSGSGTENGAGGAIILFFMLGLIASLVVGWVIFPQVLYSQKKQPVDFNHVLHSEEVEDGCESCHFFREDGTYSGIPGLAQCIDCHEEVNGEDPEEEKFVNEYVAKEREVPWLSYAQQPQNVFFSHSAHVIKAQMECVTCHGDIGESESLKVYEENRISGYSRDIWGRNIAGITHNSWDRMKMDACSACHVKENVNQNSVQTHRGGCFVCHK
jgi:menaquinone reductase, multiheme cytochrome c subunit